jgi:serine/threonine protein kinase
MIPRLPVGFSHPMPIGQGAFASVYRVRQKTLDRWVALKFIYEKDRVKRHELLKEAQTQSKLRAECVPLVHDAFEWRDSVCMVMEWLSGISAMDLLASELSVDDRYSVAGAFIHALAMIHERGFVHRDIKPENIIITADRGVFLVDFGFTKNIADQFKSAVAHAKGTPGYMAPELWRQDKQPDLMRADVYSAGKILKIMLTETPAETVTNTLLSDDPAKRPASAVEVEKMWTMSPWKRPEPPDWKRIAGDLVAQRLSVDLLEAVKQLYRARRDDEAYWLLVESIENDGNNREAMEFMKAFRRPMQKRISWRYRLVASVAIVVSLIAAFFAGIKSNETAAPLVSIVNPGHASLLGSIGKSNKRYASIALREDSLQTDRLCGKLLVRYVSPGSTVLIDGRPAPCDTLCESGLRLHPGDHDVVIRDSASRLLRRETIALLPFQTKIITMPHPPLIKEGKIP